MHHRTPYADRQQRARDLRGLQPLLDLVVELLAQKRHRAEHGRLQELHVARDGPEGLHELHLAADVERTEEVGREAERVEERQHGEEAVVFTDVCVERLESAVDVSDEVAVREHRALRLACRSGSVDDRGNVVFLRDVRVVPRAASRDAELVETDDLRLADGLPLVDDAVNAHDAAQLGKPRGDVHHHLEMVHVGRNDDSLGIGEYVLHLRVVQLRVQRHHRDPRARLGEVRLEPCGGVAEDDGDVLLARLKAEARAVPFGHVAHAREVFAPAAMHPGLVLAPRERVAFRSFSYVLFKKSADSHFFCPVVL